MLPTDYTIRDAKPRDYGYVCDAFRKVNGLSCLIQPEQYRPITQIAPKWQFMMVALGIKYSSYFREKYCLKIAETTDGERIGVVLAESQTRSKLSWSAFEKVAHIENITVPHAYGKSGVAESLMQAAEQWAKETGHTYMTGEISNRNSRSLKLSHDLGFIPISTNVGKRLA